MRKKLTALILGLGIFFTAFAETFIVSSNADSGPGTLREAIEKANGNGTSETDHIQFNIPDLVFLSRIINLNAELPTLTSNIIIDGTTQPGEVYANTDAKICLKKDSYTLSFSMLKIENATNVKIFGLYLYYGYWEGFFSSDAYRSKLLYGINIIKSFNIEIGAPHKGNVINGVEFGIYSKSDSCRNIKICSNYIGLGGYYKVSGKEDVDDVVLGIESSVKLYNVRDITIGGATYEEGNVIDGRDGIEIETKYATGNGYVNIRHNSFKKWFDRTTSLDVYDYGGGYIDIGSINSDLWEKDFEVSLLDNEIPSSVSLGYLSKPFVIQRNQFSGKFESATYGSILKVFVCKAGGLIGGEDEANANVFKNTSSGYKTSSISIGNGGPLIILKNVFECNSTYGSTIMVANSWGKAPFAQVDLTTTNSVSGRATPGSRVDLYYDDDCTACEGKQYISSVTADDNGKWTFSGNITGTIIAAATSKEGYTGSFSEPQLNIDKRVVKQPNCGKNNGSITNITAEGAESFFWINLRTKDTVSRTIDLQNAGPGEYLLYGRHGTNCINPIGGSITLEDYSPKIATTWSTITQPNCGNFNGSVYGVQIYEAYNSVIEWNKERTTFNGGQFNKYNLAPGDYQLIARDTLDGCSDTANFKLINQSGPTLLTTNMQINHATCGQRNGSIKNIGTSNISGTPYIAWVDSIGKVFGSALDLNNVPAGKYRLKFKDVGGCDTIFTPFYTIQNLGGIRIDSTQILITASYCKRASGEIKGVIFDGATSYSWTNGSGQVVSNQANPGLLFPGNYNVNASNTYGCIQLAGPFIVPVTTEYDGPSLPRAQIRPGYCNRPEGYVRFLNYTNPDQYTFRWVDSVTNQTISNELNLENIITGTFYLYSKDVKGCEQKSMLVRTWATPLPVIDESKAVVTNEYCGDHLGKIEQISIAPNTGSKPITYTWIDEQQKVAGSNANLLNVPSGKYYLVVMDSKSCTDTSKLYTITNRNIAYTTLKYKDQTIPKNTAASLSTLNVQTGTYQLFDHPSAITPIQENATGVFITDTLQSSKTFYVHILTGSCTSELTAVHINVVDKTQVFVPTAFSPNMDGRNEVLKPVVFGMLQLEFFTIYDRWGSVVFTTKDLSKGWNGYLKGIQAPIGVYIWILKGKDIRGNIINMKGSVALMR